MASTWKKWPTKGEKRPSRKKKLIPSKACILNFPGGRVLTLVTPHPLGASAYSCGRPSAKVIINCTIFSENTHHVILSKYTQECTHGRPQGGGQEGALAPPGNSKIWGPPKDNLTRKKL